MKGKWLGIMPRLALLFLGFSFVCLGAYLKSLDSGSDTTLAAIFAYILVVCGILMLLMGAFWSICLAMKSSWHRPSRSRRGNSQVFIYTVDRPNFYPPPYEESQARASPVFTINHVCLGVAPPLYTASSEVVNEDFSYEQPPSYYQALGGAACPTQASCQRSSLTGTTAETQRTSKPAAERSAVTGHCAGGLVLDVKWTPRR